MKQWLMLITAAVLCAAVALCSCGAQPEKKQDASSAAYQQITQAQAARMMQIEKNAIILDVRTREEYAAGHIPDAICIPNESIGTGEIPALPDKEQILLVYCRSGRRSKEAAQKLADLGYTRVYEFGGIIDWTGETVTGE